jgi:hypothetical protein
MNFAGMKYITKSINSDYPRSGAQPGPGTVKNNKGNGY